MKYKTDRLETFVSRVKTETERCFLDLLKENEALRSHNALLASEKSSLEREVPRLRQEAEDHYQELTRLRHQLADVDAVNESFSERFDQAMRCNDDLESLYVAGGRLSESLNRSDLLEAIDEIIVNLIGSEHFAVFEVRGSRLLFSGDGATEEGFLDLAVWSRIDPQRYRTIPLGSGRIGRVAATGEPYLPGAEAPEVGDVGHEEPVACIPLKLGDRIIGAIAIFRLEPRKAQGLEDRDLELLELLTSRAATALYCASLHARFQSEAV